MNNGKQNGRSTMGWVYTDYIAPYLPEATARKLHTWPPTATGQKKIRYN